MAKKEVMNMGTCEHEQVAFVKGQNKIFCCPESHAKIFAMGLKAKGFKATSQRMVIA